MSSCRSTRVHPKSPPAQAPASSDALAGPLRVYNILEYYERIDGRGFEEIRRLNRVAAPSAIAVVEAARLGRAGFSVTMADAPAGKAWAFAERPCLSFGGPPQWLQVIEVEIADPLIG